MEPTDRKLLDRVRDTLRLKHYSIRTVQELLGHKACPEPVEGACPEPVEGMSKPR